MSFFKQNRFAGNHFVRIETATGVRDFPNACAATTENGACVKITLLDRKGRSVGALFEHAPVSVVLVPKFASTTTAQTDNRPPDPGVHLNSWGKA